MDPQPECSKLEFWDKEGKPYLKEYVGSSKLEGKTAIITGGDSVRGSSRKLSLYFFLSSRFDGLICVTGHWQSRCNLFRS